MQSLLDRLGPWCGATTWQVAFSGGLDSTVLLYLLADLASRHALPPIKAIHVHHGLQPVADTWPEHCQSVCDALGIPLTVLRVQVDPGASLEQAARRARYGAFETCLEVGDILMTAQHRDDQAETLLFRLLRGAGVRGLAGMPMQRPLGRGLLLRPLLDSSREQLAAYAHEHGLRFINDPSNDDPRFSRNFLRHRLMPVVAEHWPQAVVTLTRAAANLREAQALLDDVAREDLQAAVAVDAWFQLPALALGPLAGLSAARQRNALQAWLALRTRLPDAQHWRGWENLRDAAADGQPIWALADGELHRCAGTLYWLSGGWLADGRSPSVRGPLVWADVSRPLALPGNGSVWTTGVLSVGKVDIRYRAGGEVMHIPGRGHRDLKRLLQEAGVPGFARARLPLLFIDGQLRAVAGLSISGQAEVQLHWIPPTSDQCLR